MGKTKDRLEVFIREHGDTFSLILISFYFILFSHISLVPVAPGQSSSSPVGYLVPPSSPVLPYVASPNLEAAASAPLPPYAAPGAKAASPQSPAAGLIPSPPVIPSLLSGVAAAPAVPEAPAIVMPPGLRPPPENGPPNLALPGGVRRLQIPVPQQRSYQRPASYQPDYTGYYGDRNRAADRSQSLQGYRNSPYSNTQRHWSSRPYYPASSYQRMGIPSYRNTFQRRYRQTDDVVFDQPNAKLSSSGNEKTDK